MLPRSLLVARAAALASLFLVAACDDDAPPPTLAGEPAPVCGPTDPTVVSADSLFREMAEPELFARLPASPWKSALASSYDRRSIDPTTPDWFANADWTGAIRTEGEERVLLDVEGPGAIVRIWSANPTGVLRIYLDASATPTVEANLVDLLEGRVPPFEKPFAFTVANGRNLVYPIPFASHAKVTTTAPSLYVNIDHRLYPPGTVVMPFDAAGSATLSCERDVASATLEGEYLAEFGTIATGALASDGSSTFSLGAPRGGRVITSLALDVDRLDADALRRTKLVARFDGETTVEAPLGDLFAFEPSGIDVNALPLSADHLGHFELRFPMPFAETAELALEDVGAGPVHATVRARVVARRFDERSMHFHARWTAVHTFDVFDPSLFHVARIEGTGTYVGTVLHVANPHTAWWGEGDEQVWVDGEAFPSHFGTGTEDYFGYAFCSTERFSHAYLGQTRANADDFAGFVSLYRFHFADAIPFTQSLVFDLEVLHWQKGMSHVNVSYDAVYFFYARPGATVDDAERVPPDFVLPTLPEGVVHVGPGSTRC